MTVLAADMAAVLAVVLAAAWAAVTERAEAVAAVFPAATAPHQSPAAPTKILKLPHR